MVVLVETETLQFEAIENPAVAAPSGAGIQAAQLVVERGTQAVVTGNVGPNALEVFQSAGVPIYLFDGGTVRDAVEAFKAGKLQPIAIPNAQAGAGTSTGQGMGMGGRAAAPPAPGAPPPLSVPANSREEEIAALKETTSELQRQLDEARRRLDELTAG